MTTKTIALFKNVKWDFDMVHETRLSLGDEYVQLSKPVEIEFELLDESERINNEIAIIEKQIEETRQDAITKVEALLDRKSKLLALTHE